MLVSKNHGFVYVDNPYAGTSQMSSMLKCMSEDPIKGYRKSPMSWEKRIFNTQHLSIKDAINYGFVKKETVESIPYWLTCVRDPVDRFLAAFEDYKQDNRLLTLNVNEFIRNQLTFDAIEFDWRMVGFRSQVEMIRVPYRAQYFIMHYEKLEDNWPHACMQIFGESEEYELAVYPTSYPEDPLDILSESSLQRLTLLYLEDYMTFLYKPLVETLEMPEDQWARIEVIQRDAHRNTLLYGNGTIFPLVNIKENVSKLSIFEREALDNILEAGGWNNV